MKWKHPPGSPEAVSAGCLCPVIDNCHGKGSGPLANGFWFVITLLCPLHGLPEDGEAS